MVIMVSFRSGSPLDLGPFTLKSYLLTYSYPLTYKTLLNSVLYAGVSLVLVMSIAILFAWLIERTDMPLRNLGWTLILLPIGMPSFLLTMSWILLLNPTVGMLNVTLRPLFDFFAFPVQTGPFNIYSLGGMIFVNSITGLTTVFLLIVGAFRLVNQEIEDAALVSGATSRTTLFKITLPILLPTLTVASLYKFAGDLNDMDIPLLLGLQPKIYVLPTLIFFSAFYGTPVQWGLATALSSPFIVIAVALTYVYFRVIIRQAKAQRFVTVTGKRAQVRRIHLGRWRYPALALFFLYFLIEHCHPFTGTAVGIASSRLSAVLLGGRRSLDVTQLHGDFRMARDRSSGGEYGHHRRIDGRIHDARSFFYFVGCSAFGRPRALLP